MKFIIILLVTVSLFACANFKKQDNSLSIIENECNEEKILSKKCEILNLKDLSIDEKENLIGWLYLNGGDGVKQDYNKAYFWFEKSALSQNDEALNSLGNIYYLGLGRGKNYIKAEEYYSQAYALGNKDAIFNLAELYRNNGFGKLPDYNKAEEIYRSKIIDNPYKSYEGLSKIYIEKGAFKEAFIYSKKAADLNNPEAEYNLGVFYEKGIYVEKDIEKALYWYERAAKKGHLDAKNNLEVIEFTKSKE
ncbi:sel1 repeat family protein [Acinetobacter cumulans]|jgi:TPR repeat protein|uniref:tetratricopeptide repeat protein n=1 Tax=Acinetobacter cumulans TaxID=2136182 RepID=UPI000D11DB84|nr:tetratricopeptide repeat protein [Acinetobacter cumulans]QCO21229.1 sel1 repeat family protein [Acinetobacter cumulans]RKG51817.1 sel1 repeat family protein [Acinetobacter cumulans]